MTYEEKLRRIDELVRLLERGDAPLADSMRLFREATTLLEECSKELKEAEQEVVRLSKGPDGAPVEAPFADEEADT